MNPEYDFELNKVMEKIKTENCKLVCIQLPDGLKPLAGEIQKKIEEATHAKVIIYAASCWGGCDIPLGLDKIGVDLLVQFGHAIFKRPW